MSQTNRFALDRSNMGFFCYDTKSGIPIESFDEDYEKAEAYVKDANEKWKWLCERLSNTKDRNCLS